MWVGLAVAVCMVGAAAWVLARRPREPRAPRAQAADAGDVAARLDAFWAWWGTESGRLAVAFDERRAEEVSDELSQQVLAIHPGLAWETGPGLKGARHHLALSSEGNAELRVLTERWLARAPAPDAAWEYYPARQRSPGDRKLELTLHDAPDVEIEFLAARVALEVDETREVVHVRFHHPALARLPEKQRSTAAFLMLDDVLGEDGVERWVGNVDLSVEPIPEAKPLAALGEAVATLAAHATGEQWVLLEGRTVPGRPLLAMANVAIKRSDHLLMDQHLEVTVPFEDEAEQGMPSGAESDVLNTLEDELIAALGHDAVYIGHETGDGRRTIHLHVAAQGPVEGRLDAWVKKAGRAIQVEYHHDPGWELLRKWQ